MTRGEEGQVAGQDQRIQRKRKPEIQDRGRGDHIHLAQPEIEKIRGAGRENTAKTSSSWRGQGELLGPQDLTGRRPRPEGQKFKEGRKDDSLTVLTVSFFLRSLR